MATVKKEQSVPKNITTADSNFREKYLYSATIIDDLSIDTDIQRHLVKLVETL